MTDSVISPSAVEGNTQDSYISTPNYLNKFKFELEPAFFTLKNQLQEYSSPWLLTIVEIISSFFEDQNPYHDKQLNILLTKEYPLFQQDCESLFFLIGWTP